MVTAASDGTLLDRRRVELVDPNLPKHPYHHEGQHLPLAEALDLIERVRASAERHARQSLDELANAVPTPIGAIALRMPPPLPETTAERITNYRAQCVADSVMYRVELAVAAMNRGWIVDWYNHKTVLARAGTSALIRDIEGFLDQQGAIAGPPWQRDHRFALAAAIAASSAPVQEVGTRASRARV